MITQRDIRKISAALNTATMVELICSDLPGWYRLALLRQEMSTLDAAAADDLLGRVLGRLDHDDPLVVLMST